jgi:hypothetical protein
MARKRSKNRVGDVLGLGGAPSSSPTSPQNDDRMIGMDRSDEAHRRHHRMSEGADELTPEPSAPHRSSGATGIDMGSGGEGTDLE